MLLVKQPLALVFLTVGKGVDAITLAFAFDKIALVCISIVKNDITLAVWFVRNHLTFVNALNAHLFYLTRA